jgi:hypothetical protein
MPLIVVIKTYVFGSALGDIFAVEDIGNWYYIKRAQSGRAHNNK